MNIGSEIFAQTIIEEKRREVARWAEAAEAIRFAKEQRQAEPAKDEPKRNVWQFLKNLAQRVQQAAPQAAPVSSEVVPSEQDMCHAEELGMSPEELIRRMQKTRLFERIARGNALIEVEYMSRQLQEGRR